MEYASEMNGMEIAIIGMAVRFPQSRTLHEFWHNIVQGKECVTFFSEEELLAEGVEQSTLDNPAYVRAKPYIEGICDFDAAFFGYSHKEAQTLDPKSRVLHEVAGNDSNLLIVFYVQIMPDDFVMQLHRF